MTPAYLGIDPGKNGGLALLDAHGAVLWAVRMPSTEADLYARLLWAAEYLGGVALVERVHAFPGMGVVSAFTFGRGYGSLLMGLQVVGIPFDLVSPVVWQRGMGCLTKGDKTISKRRAQQLFPGLTITHAIADALLIASYCRRLNRRHDDGQEETRRAAHPARDVAHPEGQAAAQRAITSPAGPGAGAQRPARSDLRGAGRYSRHAESEQGRGVADEAGGHSGNVGGPHPDLQARGHRTGARARR